jgi:hypothetical protein
MTDPDLERFKAAWIHLTPLQKKIIVWRVWIELIRSRAFRFVNSLIRSKSNE